MRLFSIAVLAVVVACLVGCGDAAESESDFVPETTELELASVVFQDNHHWNEKDSFSFTLAGHGLKHGDVYAVAVRCSQACSPVGSVDVFSQGETVVEGARFSGAEHGEILIPADKLQGSDYVVELTLSSHMRPIILSVVALVLK